MTIDKAQFADEYLDAVPNATAEQLAWEYLDRVGCDAETEYEITGVMIEHKREFEYLLGAR